MEDDVTKYGNTYEEDEQESNVETIIRCQKTDREDLPKDWGSAREEGNQKLGAPEKTKRGLECARQ